MDNKAIISEIYNLVKKESFVKIKNFSKNDIVTDYVINRNYIYFVLYGKLSLLKNSKYGDEIFIDEFFDYDFFGDMFYDVLVNNEMFVVCESESRIFYFDYDLIKEKNEFVKIFNLIFMLMNNKLKNMNMHTAVLAEKTIRDKILTYIDIIKINNKVEIDLSYKKLARFLNVDRSSLMRELKLLENDKMIKRDKKVIEILFR